MRVILIAAFVATLVAAVAAQCGTAPAVNPFAPTACPAFRACDAAFCACAGVSNTSSTNASTCLASSSATCTVLQSCLANYTGCLVALESSTSTDAGCNASVTNMHALVLQAAVTSYTGSALQAACRYQVCQVMNRTTTTCTFGTNFSNVCMDRPPAFAFQATIRLSGSQWAALLSSPLARAQLEAALQSDLATLLGVIASFIKILNLSVGSLIVDFAVLAGSNKTADQLAASVLASGNNTSWLTTTKSVYSVVSNETISVIGVTLVGGGTTSAPIVITPPGPSTPSGPSTPPTPSTPGGTSPGGSASSTSVIVAAAMAMAVLLTL
jgi:hypothetical protein